MLKLNKLIYDNLSSRELDVKFLTTQMGMSRTPLYAKLKALTNMGVNDYINMIRIDKACQLLVGSSMNITEISETVGFEYPRHFSTLFKQLKGMPPSQYRNSKATTKECDSEREDQIRYLSKVSYLVPVLDTGTQKNRQYQKIHIGYGLCLCDPVSGTGTGQLIYFYIFTCREPRLSTENGFPFADIAVFFVEVGADFD